MAGWWSSCCSGGGGGGGNGQQQQQFDIVFCLNSCRRFLLPGDRQFQNVILLSVSFMLIFTAFQTLTNIEETVLKSIRAQDPSFTGDGYTSLAIIYTVFAISNWIVPPIVALIKAKWTMIFGGAFYVLFIASFLYPRTWLLYTMSALIGFGGAFLWTAQGNYLTLSSSAETMSRNSGVFWAILQCSMFFGNGFVFWMFEGKKEIDRSTQVATFSVLTAVGCLGILALLCLRSPEQRPREEQQQEDNANSSPDDLSATSPAVVGDNGPAPPRPPPPPLPPTSDESAIVAIKKTLSLIRDRDILLLISLFFYTGLELSFQSGVYSTSVGDTLELDEAKRLVGLCGIMIGAGEVAGGALFGLLGSQTVRNGRDPVILLGFISHTVAFFLIFLNLPNDSPLRATYAFTFIGPTMWIVMFCAFLLGFGDACFQTQIYSILGALFPHNSSPPFAWFKFTQSTGAAISFFYSSVTSLATQLILLQLVLFIGTLTFFLVEWKLTRSRISEEEARHLINSAAEDHENYG